MSQWTLPPIADKPNPRWFEARPYEGQATNHVVDRFELAEQITREAWRDARSVLSDLRRAALDLTEILKFTWTDAPAPVFGNIPPAAREIIPAIPPGTVPAIPPFLYTPPTLRGYPTPFSPVIPSFPPIPNWNVPRNPNLTPPQPRTPNIPPRPNLVFPDRPRVQHVPIPPKPEINLDLPWSPPPSPDPGDLDIPVRNFDYEDVEPRVSRLLQVIEEKLSSTIIDGGSMLPPAVEDALYGRAVYRLETERALRVEQAIDSIASRGFSIPPGVLHGMVIEIEKEFARQLNQVNIEIVINQAQMANENMKHALAVGKELEEVLIGEYQTIANRKFEIAKTSLQFHYEQFRVRAEIFNLRLQAINIYADTWEKRLRGEFLKAEVWKVEIEGAKLSLEVQRLYAEIYEIVMRGLAVEVELYKSLMGAAGLELEIERLHVDIYKTRYEAFATEVRAHEAEIGAFNSRIQIPAELIKAEALKGQLYMTEVDAVTKEREGVLRQKEHELEVRKLEVQGHLAEVERIKSVFSMEVARLDAIIKKDGHNVQVYATDADVETKKYSAQMQEFDAKVRQNIAKAQMDIEAGKATMEAERTEIALHIERLKHIASVLAQVTASALGAVNATAQIGFNASWSSGISNAFQTGYSQSQQDSTSRSLTVSLDS